MELKKLENEVLKPSIEDRGALAEKLILSVDAPSETENLRLWVAEAEIAVECSVLDIRFHSMLDVRRSMFDVHLLDVDDTGRGGIPTCQSRYLMRKVTFHPEADNEVIEAARYYETRSAGINWGGH